MRVEAYNSVAQIYKTNRAAGASAAAKISCPTCTFAPQTEKSRDQVEISSIGYDYQIAKQAVAEASDIREDKVAALSAKVKSGTYDVSNEAFAEKLLEKYRSFML